MKSKLTYLKKLELFKELDNYRNDHFFAIADTNVKNHLPQWIQFSSRVFWLNSPEAQKDVETYTQALDFFLAQGIQRESIIYSFGGGATSDFSGFVAATILRGVEWVAIPTTLLAMVDASIGGKVGINMPVGKNLVGSFHLPKEVFVCDEFLSTLGEDQMSSGRGEILKYGFLSQSISDLIIKKAPLEKIIVECARFKIQITESDFKEKNQRILLNLGHTLGHAFESTLKIPHGLAIAMGMKYLFEISHQDKVVEHWNNMAASLNLPLETLKLKSYPDFSVKEFFKFLDHDKKMVKSAIRLVLVKEIGDCYTEEVAYKDFKTKIMNHADFRD